MSHFSEIDRKIFGFSFSKIDAKSIATMICDPRSSSGVGLIVTPNTDHIVNLRRNVEFANAYRWAAVIVCDGFPIQYYARLRGIQVERVTGCDIMIELMSIAGSGQRLFFIVDSDPTATALKEWGEVHRVAVETAVPHYGFEDNIEESNRLLDQITEHRTTILVMAVGAPKSEVWVWRHQCELPTCWALCTGQAVRIALGLTARAPKLIRSLHGEWLWRICQEPRRLAGRYIRGSAMFLVAVLEDSLRRKDRASNELVDLYGQICDAMPPNLVSELKMVDFDDGIGVTIRSGKKLWFASDTSASVIARCIVGSICGSSAKKVPLKTAIYGNEK